MAVYTGVSDENAATFVVSYDIGERGIAEGMENSNLLLSMSSRPHKPSSWPQAYVQPHLSYKVLNAPSN